MADDLPERLGGRWTTRRADAVVTCVVMLLSFVDSWVKPSNGLLRSETALALGLVSAAVGSLVWWRRQHPGLVAVLIMVGYIAAFTPVAMGVAMYTVGTVNRRVRTLVAFAVAGSLAAVVTLAADRTPLGARDFWFTLALALGPLGMGYAVGVRRDLAVAIQQHLDDLEREQDLLAEQARSEERARIAREMHDVVAHRVSSMVLAAGALQMSGQALEPPVAQAAEQIRSDGRQALEELREVLGVLAPGRRSAPMAPQPDASRLSELVEETDARGLVSARLQVEGFPETLPAAVQRALYRVVQESLTNAAKHSPGCSVEVRVECARAGVRIEVVNSAPTRAVSADLPSSGHGLDGLAERVSVLGGSLEVGPAAGGFVVSAFIPHRRTRPTSSGGAHDTAD